MRIRTKPCASVECRSCGAAVPIAVASRTFGYCEACQPVLAGMAGDVAADRESAAAVSGEELTAKMREARNVSAKAGDLERNSPLFFGTGENPGLF